MTPVQKIKIADNTATEKARLLAVSFPLAPCTAHGLCRTAIVWWSMVRVAVAHSLHRLGCKACEPHSVCGKAVSARGLHGLAPRHQRHSQL